MEPRWKRRWRDYRTERGRSPVREFMNALPAEHRDVVRAHMRLVVLEGLAAARHLSGEIYEVRIPADRSQYRILFALDGHRDQILLSLEAFTKKTQKTPPDRIALAEQRLANWRRRRSISPLVSH
jgi:phage-related protein